MKNLSDLKTILYSIDQKDYGSYQSIKGSYTYENFNLEIYSIPKDPFAPPHTGTYRVFIHKENMKMIFSTLKESQSEVAFCDYFIRRFYKLSKKVAQSRGTGYSGIITVNEPSQVYLKRSNLFFNEDILELRCFVGLPSKKRIIQSEIAEKMLLEDLPHIIEETFFIEKIDMNHLRDHIKIYQDSTYLRNQLDKSNLIAFIPNGANLPRESGISDLPLKTNPVLFEGPKELEVEFDLPHSGKIKGCGFKKGVNLVVGGGFHGKSTLLKAIQYGVYDHIPDDGRTFCVTLKNAIKVRSYDGRKVNNTNISRFINNLPSGKNTTSFYSENASGSTSQAASIIEAIEAGTDLLLLDEDTSATNFMVRDELMKQLISDEDEPITPFIECVRSLYDECGISTILVLGGIGDYFKVSDHVIQMKNYHAMDVTNKAKQLNKSSVINPIDHLEKSNWFTDRKIIKGSFAPFNDYHHFRIYSKSMRELIIGNESVDLTDIEQLKEETQIKTIGFALHFLDQRISTHLTIRELILFLEENLQNNSLDLLSEQLSGYYSEFRSIDLVHILNRIRHIELTT